MLRFHFSTSDQISGAGLTPRRRMYDNVQQPNSIKASTGRRRILADVLRAPPRQWNEAVVRDDKGVLLARIVELAVQALAAVESW